MDSMQTGMKPKCNPYDRFASRHFYIQITDLSVCLASCYLANSITDTLLHP